MCHVLTCIEAWSVTAPDAAMCVFVVESNLGLERREEQVIRKVSDSGFGSRLKEEEWEELVS